MSRLLPVGAHRSRRLLPAMTSEEGHRATPLELFFDLAYVFAFTQVSRLMAHQHDGVGLVQGLVVLALLWWSWTAFAWLSNHAHADEGVVRVAMMVAMIALFVGGLVVPEAFAAHHGGLPAPVVLVGAYLVARAAHAAVYVLGDVDAPAMRRRVVRAVLLPLAPSAALLVLGAQASPGVRLWCWLGAVVLEPALSYLATRGTEFRVPSAAHLAERYGLVVILSLGESVLAIGVGVGAAGEPVGGPALLGSVLAMLVSIGLWWAYFARYARPAEHALAGLHGGARARLANEGYSYLHLVVVAGIVLAALGVEGAMAHVGDGEPLGGFAGAALGGGLALFVAGTSLFARRMLGAWPVVRTGGALVLLAVVPVLGAVRPLAALGLVVLLLVALLVAEHAEAGRRRPGVEVEPRGATVRGA